MKTSIFPKILAALCASLTLATSSASGQNLAQNPSFETGNTTGWTTLGSLSISAQSAEVHSGNYAALVSNRSDVFEGIAQSFTGVLSPGQNYTLSAWVRLVSGANQTVNITVRKKDDSGTNFTPVASGTATATGWTQISGVYTYNPVGIVTDVTCYAPVPTSATVSYYLDDFVLEPIFHFATSVQQGNGGHWAQNIWQPGGVTPIGGNTYEVILGASNPARIRNPASGSGDPVIGVKTFPGDSLQLNASTEIRAKGVSGGVANTLNFPGVGGNPGLILNGGTLDNGDNGAIFGLTGVVLVQADSSFACGDSLANNTRGWLVGAEIKGNANLTITKNFAGGVPAVELTGINNPFTGNWIVNGGIFKAAGLGSLGSGGVTINPGAAGATFEPMYNVESLGGLTISPGNTVMILHQECAFVSLTIDGQSFENGFYLYSVLQQNYPAHFPPGGSGSITVRPPCVSPAVTSPPVSVSACEGGTAQFMVAATGTVLTYQWRKNGVPIPGATSSTLMLSALTASDADSYEVFVANECGSAIGGPAMLTVHPAGPHITQQPASATVCPGSTVSLVVEAEAHMEAGILNYQWRKDGFEIAGATFATLTLTAVTDANNGQYSVVVSEPNCGSSTSHSAMLIVADPPPAITLIGPASVQVECHGSFIDPGASANDVCAGSLSVSVSGSVNVNSPGTYIVTYSATNPAGNTGLATRTVNVVDTTPPSIACPASVTLMNGQAPIPDLQIAATVSDTCCPAAGIALSQQPAPGTMVEPGTYSVTLTATDCSGNQSTCTTTVTITKANTPPVVEMLEPASGLLVIVDSQVQLKGSFTDDGPTGTHTAQWFIKNGPSPETVITGTVVGMMVSNRVSFTEAGVYSIKLVVTDGDGLSGEATTVLNDLPAYVVVYDPNGGFVTGGGWVWSPPRAFHPDLEADATVEGRATFGFVSKYQRGATVPKGNTEFQFQAGNLNFHSHSYQWLVVGGARAQYKGTGTINNEGTFGFLLTAVDGQVENGEGYDRFRIKIWDGASRVVIYDNQPSTDDSADLDDSTILRGGSVVIHK